MRGCYAVELSEWTDSQGVIQQYPSDIVHQRINFTTVPIAADGISRWVVRPAPGTPESWYEDVSWGPDPDGAGIVVRWANPLHGITAVVEFGARAEDGRTRLDGQASTWGDELGASLAEARVSLIPIEC